MPTLLSYPRIHITLIDLCGCTGRLFGGIGFLVDILPVKVHSHLAEKNSIDFKGEVDARFQKEISSYFDKLTKLFNVNINIVIERPIKSHIGFGSKTSTMLAIAKSIAICSRRSFDINDAVVFTNRGGASGIGLNAFFTGGVVVDAGHKFSVGMDILPSHYIYNKTIPPIVTQCDFPSAWSVHLLLPEGHNINGEREKSLFLKKTPIPNKEALEVFTIVYYKILLALKECDYELFQEGISEISNTGFKKIEIESQVKICSKIISFFNNELKLAAGMSSMGPLLYIITVSDKFDSEIINYCKSENVKYLGKTLGRNKGFELECYE